jgi:hypothetical protein
MVDIKWKYKSKISFVRVNFKAKFCKSLGFSLREHCEWGTRTFPWNSGDNGRLSVILYTSNNFEQPHVLSKTLTVYVPNFNRYSTAIAFAFGNKAKIVELSAASSSDSDKATLLLPCHLRRLARSLSKWRASGGQNEQQGGQGENKIVKIQKQTRGIAPIVNS